MPTSWDVKPGSVFTIIVNNWGCRLLVANCRMKAMVFNVNVHRFRLFIVPGGWVNVLPDVDPRVLLWFCTS